MHGWFARYCYGVVHDLFALHIELSILALVEDDLVLEVVVEKVVEEYVLHESSSHETEQALQTLLVEGLSESCHWVQTLKKKHGFPHECLIVLVDLDVDVFCDVSPPLSRFPVAL